MGVLESPGKVLDFFVGKRVGTLFLLRVTWSDALCLLLVTVVFTQCCMH